MFAVLIFSSDTMLDNFGLKSIVTDYRAHLGVGFLVTLALILVNSTATIWKFVYHNY